MKRPRNIANVTTIVLLSFGLLICTGFMAVTLFTSTAEAKSPSVLLQEGLYAEEIEGNLDAAIKIYERVIAEAKAAEQTAAQATYRIGMCHLKKGQKAQAAEHFQSIVSKFPQQDSLVAKAQEHLAKLKPPVAIKGLTFGPERLVKLYDIDHPTTKDKERLIDLDEGKLSRIPDIFEEMDDRQRMQWMEENGVDVVAEISAHDRGLVGFGMATRMMPPHVWDEIGPLEVQVEMAQTQSAREGTAPMFFEGRKYKPVFLFRTRESGLGILQILDADDEQQHVEFRYKMVGPDRRFAVAMARSQEMARRVESGKKLFTLVKALLVYANEDEASRYPDTLRDLEEGDYLDKDILNWALENVEYLGEGKTPADNPGTVLGYDRNLLQKGDGTNVLFLDCHVAFVEPDELEEFGIRATTGAYVFGPVIERVLSDESEEGQFLIDFDTGRLYSMPDKFYGAQPVQILPWARNHGIDASLEDSLPGFETDGLTAVRLDEEDWTNLTAVALKGLLANRRAHIESVEEDGFPSVRLMAEKPGACFGLRTREGGVGILQIADIMEDPWRVKIHYKMLQAQGWATTGLKYRVYLPDLVTPGAEVVLDLASGEMFSAEALQQDRKYCEKLGKGDLVYDWAGGVGHLVCLRGAKVISRRRDGGTSVSVRRTTRLGEYLSGLPTYGIDADYDYVVVSGDGYRYELRILSWAKGHNGGMEVEYWNPEAKTAWEVAAEFLSAAVSGNDSEAIKLAKPGSAAVRQMDDFRKITNRHEVEVTTVYVANEVALACTTDIAIEDEKGLLLLRLIKQRGIWMVEDVDFERPESLKAEIDSFLKSHPNAKELPLEAVDLPGQVGLEGDPAKAMELLLSLKGQFKAIDKAVDKDDPQTALLLLDELDKQRGHIEHTFKGTAVEPSVKTVGQMVTLIRDALKNQQMDRAESLLEILGEMGPQIESALGRTRDLSRREESLRKLSLLGKAVTVYANEQESGRFPERLRELYEGDYLSKKDLEWLLENAAYLGREKTERDRPDTIVAYDKSLLEQGEGTNVLFLDTHVEFLPPDGLEKLGIRPTASDYGLGPGDTQPPYTRELFADIRPDRSVNYKTTIRDRNESDAPTTTSVFCTDHIYLTAMYDHKDRPIEFTMDRSGQNFRYHVTLNEPVMPGEMIVYWGEGTKRGMVGRRGDGTLHYHTWYCPRASQPVLRIETYLLPEGAELVPPTWSNIQRQNKDGRIELRLERIVPGDRRITTMFNYRLPGSEQISEADKEADGVGR